MVQCDKTNRRKTLDEFALEAEAHIVHTRLSSWLSPLLRAIECISVQLRDNEHWAMIRSLVEGVRAAGGTWAAYARLPRRRVLRLRSLMARGRARTADPIIEPVFRLPNEMCWHVLEFWRATCATTGEVL